MEPSIPGAKSLDAPCSGTVVTFPASSTVTCTMPRLCEGSIGGVCGCITPVPVTPADRSLQPTTAASAAITPAARIAEEWKPRRRDIVFPRAPSAALFSLEASAQSTLSQKQRFDSVDEACSERQPASPCL